MPKSDEPESTVVEATEGDYQPMQYTVVQATDHDGNLIEPTAKPGVRKHTTKEK